MFYEPRKGDHGLPHDPFKALVAPRPIGWITTQSLAGAVNLAPFSFFNAFQARPHLVGFGRGHPDGSAVDSEGYLWNCRYGGGCVVRVAPDGAVERVVEVPSAWRGPTPER